MARLDEFSEGITPVLQQAPLSDPKTEVVLPLMFVNPDFTRLRGLARLTEALRFYVEQAILSTADDRLFGAETKTTPGEILGLARQRDETSARQRETPDLLTATHQPNGSVQPDVRDAGRDGGQPDRASVQPDTGREGAGSREEVAKASDHATEGAPQSNVDQLGSEGVLGITLL